MDQQIALVAQWTSEVFPDRNEGYFIGPYLVHYTDELMRDMGLQTVRTSNPLTEYFARFLPSRYRDVGKERRRARDRRSTAVENETKGRSPEDMRNRDN